MPCEVPNSGRNNKKVGADLLVMQVVILLLGLLACVIGLVAAVPVVFCITGAAYRQLFSADDNAGFLKGD